MSRHVKMFETFGRLTVVELAKRKHNRRAALCICICGNYKLVSDSNLVIGNTTSCGCNKGGVPKTHGLTSSATYISWKNMKARCDNANNPRFADWGGRGICYDPNWARFENFLTDMGVKPEGLQLDRIDNDGHYFKENCRWITAKQNSNNRRNNV